MNSNVSRCEYNETPLPSHNCKDYRGPLSGSPWGQGKSNCWTFALDKTKPETNGRPPWFCLKVELVNNSSVNPFSLLWDLWRRTWKTIKRRWTGKKRWISVVLLRTVRQNTHTRDAMLCVILPFALWFFRWLHFSSVGESNITQPYKQVDFFNS